MEHRYIHCLTLVFLRLVVFPALTDCGLESQAEGNEPVLCPTGVNRQMQQEREAATILVDVVD